MCLWWNRSFWLELKMDISTQKIGTNLEAKLPKVMHMSRPNFFALGPLNSIFKHVWTLPSNLQALPTLENWGAKDFRGFCLSQYFVGNEGKWRIWTSCVRWTCGIGPNSFESQYLRESLYNDHRGSGLSTSQTIKIHTTLISCRFNHRRSKHWYHAHQT